MEAAKFNALLERLSARAQRHPTLYKFQVLGLALVGYLLHRIEGVR